MIATKSLMHRLWDQLCDQLGFLLIDQPWDRVVDQLLYKLLGQLSCHQLNSQLEEDV